MAASDPRFERRLLAQREAALEGTPVKLRESERALLRTAPEPTLRALIASLDLSPENVQRRRFMQTVAAGAVALSAAGCGEDSGKQDMAGPQPDGGPVGEGLPVTDTVPQNLDVTIRDVGILPDRRPWDGPAGDTIGHEVDAVTGDRGILPDGASYHSGMLPPPEADEASNWGGEQTAGIRPEKPKTASRYLPPVDVNLEPSWGRGVGDGIRPDPPRGASRYLPPKDAGVAPAGGPPDREDPQD
jgi:hypothetical protein